MTAIESTAVEEPGTDLEPAAHSSSLTLFQTDDPVEVVEQAGRVADALKGVLTRQGLTQKIGGRDHVLVEGWTTLGSMLGVFAVKEWVREVPWPDPVPEALTGQHQRGLVFGYEASFLARRADGTVIGGAEADCKRSESTWKGRDDYALKSMAQTRATSKALRVPLGFIVTLAGYEATPEAEIPASGEAPAGPSRVGADQVAKLGAAFTKADKPFEETNAKLDELGVPAGETLEERIPLLDPRQADTLLAWLTALAEAPLS